MSKTNTLLLSLTYKELHILKKDKKSKILKKVKNLPISNSQKRKFKH